MEYYWIEAEVAGYVGDRADYIGNREPSLLGTLYYEFEDWLGDDIVTTRDFWCITDRLAEALKASELTGWALNKVIVTESPDALEPMLDKMPQWHRLVPNGMLGSDDFGLRGTMNLAISERALALLRKYNLSHATLSSVSEHPNGPPFPDILVEFMKEHGLD